MKYTIGSVKFFVHGVGSTELKQPFADPDCQIPLSIPVIADANGVLPAIYFEDTNWPYTTDATTYDRLGNVLAHYCPIGMNAVLHRGFGSL